MRSKIIWFWTLVLLLLLSSSVKAGAADVPGITKDTILVGASQPFTGPLASIGEACEAGIMSYLNPINEQGGIYGRKIKYKTEDNGFDPGKGIAGTKKLVELDKVFALLTPLGLPPVLAIIPYTVENGVPLLFPYTPASEPTTPFKKNIFMITPSIYRQFYFIADYGLKVLGAKKVCQIHMMGPGMQAAPQAGDDRCAEAGLKPLTEFFKSGQTDFSSLVLRLKAADPDFAILGGVAVPASLIMKESEKQGWKPRFGFMTHATNVDPEFVRLGGSAIEGLMALEFAEPPAESNKPSVIEFRQRLKKYYPKIPPGQFALHGYIAAKLFCEGMKKAGPDPTREKLTEALESLKNYDIGVMPPLSFSPTQHMGLANARVTKVKGGKFQSFTDWMSLPDKEWMPTKK